MVYHTRFFKIPMFTRFTIEDEPNSIYTRVGRDLYQDSSGDVQRIATLGTAVIQVNDSYYWSPS